MAARRLPRLDNNLPDVLEVGVSTAQSGERIRGRANIQASRTVQPNKKRFTVRRIVGAGDLWVTEFVLTYDGRPSYTVRIMAFIDAKVGPEIQHVDDPFEPGPSRTQWVEPIP